MSNLEQLVEVSERMAQELTDFADEGEAGGSDMSSVRELLNEYEGCRATLFHQGAFAPGCV